MIKISLYIALLVPFISMLRAAPPDGYRQHISFQGAWKEQPATSPDIPPIPDDWGKPRGDANSVWYENVFSLPAGEVGAHQVIVDFTRVEGDAVVFVNGEYVAELLMPAAVIDVTDQVAWGSDNILTVFVTRDYTGISRDFEEDYYLHKIRTTCNDVKNLKDWKFGLTAPVTVALVPETFLKDVFLIPSWRQKSLTIEANVLAARPVGNARLAVRIFDASGQTVLTADSVPTDIPSGDSTVRFSIPWEDPIAWEFDNPYLYRASVGLLQDGKTEDLHPDILFGFRELWTEGKTIMMNGHPSRWRLTDLYGANAYALSFYRLMGYNVGEIQPHPKLWGVWNEVPLFDEDLLDEADRIGMGILLPAPSVTYLGKAFVDSPELREDYRCIMAQHMARYRNHPSVIAWIVGMNSYNPQSNIHPQTLGKRELAPPEKGEVVELACEIGHQLDSGRLFFSHADGSLGDISSANTYLNFAPLQEREEWPMEWAQSGDMPYNVAEFGLPYTANFWKGRQFLFTEYAAMYLGDQAYEKESAEGLRETVKYGLLNTNGHGAMGKIEIGNFPAYWDFQNLFVKNTDRAWRAWGMNAGRLSWLLDMGYGVPPGANPLWSKRYQSFSAPVTEKPTWVNPNFDIHSQANQPLLVYLAGSPVHTDKTHAFYSGETVQKQIAVVWDGSTARHLEAEWALRSGDRILRQGRVAINLKPGDLTFVPIAFEAPSVSIRENCELTLKVSEDGELVSADALALEIYPPLERLHLTQRVAVCDPEGKSLPWLEELGVRPIEWQPGEALDGVDLLVVGREALQPGKPTPWTAAAIQGGLRVLVLEQTPVVWEQLGFHTLETMPRYAFIRDAANPVLNGLEPEDLINWRGSPDLLPEGRPVKVYDSQHAPKWTNRHAVASVVLETPQAVGFTPLLEAEFDLAYSPLLEWRYGEGMICFSTLDFTGRVWTDPAATRLASNLVKSLAQAGGEPGLSVYYVGDSRGEKLLEQLQVDFGKGIPAMNQAGTSLLVIDGETPSSFLNSVAAFASTGGTVLFLPRSGDSLSQDGLRTQAGKLYKVALRDDEPGNALLRAVGPKLLRWRDPLDVDYLTQEGQPEGTTVLLDGILAERRLGKGRVVYLQVQPEMIEDRYPDQSDQREAVQLSGLRLRELVARLMTNLGAGSSSAVANRFSSVTVPNVYQALGTWKVLGPYHSPGRPSESLLAIPFPGEQDAIEGGQNPNLVYKNSEGKALDWRKTIDADSTGFIDLGKALNAGEGSVAYVTRSIQSDEKHMARFYFGADYRIKIWVNGRVVLDVNDGHGAPRPRAFPVDVFMKKGENIVTCKVVAGGKGFGLWAGYMNTPGVESTTADAAEAGNGVGDTTFYAPLFKNFDPYQFHYW